MTYEAVHTAFSTFSKGCRLSNEHHLTQVLMFQENNFERKRQKKIFEVQMAGEVLQIKSMKQLKRDRPVCSKSHQCSISNG